MGTMPEHPRQGADRRDGRRRAVIVEENSAVPMDIRVWQEATALQRAGWDVAVVCPDQTYGIRYERTGGADGVPEYLDGVCIYRFRLDQAEQGRLNYVQEYASAFLSIARTCWRIWRKGRFDIIQFCNPPDVFFPIALLYRTLGARVIFDHHDLFPEEVARRFVRPAGRALYSLARVSEYLTFRASDVVISVNESCRQIALERGKIPRERSIVVRNGPKLSEFVPIAPDPALKRGFRFMVCYAGVMGLQDGLRELLVAIRYVVQEVDRHDVLFALLGEGAARTEVLTTLKAWGLDGQVDMPGMIRDKALLRRYLCTADVLVSPEPSTPVNERSTFVKVGEYMAVGRPIVAFDLAETRITAGEGAVYVAPGQPQAFGQAILALLDDPERCKRMGEIGRQRIGAQFCWERQEANLLAAYELAWTGGRQQRM